MPIIIIVHNKFLSLLREYIIWKSSTDYTTYNIGHQQLQYMYHMAVITPERPVSGIGDVDPKKVKWAKKEKP